MRRMTEAEFMDNTRPVKRMTEAEFMGTANKKRPARAPKRTVTKGAKSEKPV